MISFVSGILAFWFPELVLYQHLTSFGQTSPVCQLPLTCKCLLGYLIFFLWQQGWHQNTCCLHSMCKNFPLVEGLRIVIVFLSVIEHFLNAKNLIIYDYNQQYVVSRADDLGLYRYIGTYHTCMREKCLFRNSQLCSIEGCCWPIFGKWVSLQHLMYTWLGSSYSIAFSFRLKPLFIIGKLHAYFCQNFGILHDHQYFNWKLSSCTFVSHMTCMN